MTINPDGLTAMAGVLGFAGVVMATCALIMKRKLDHINRELDAESDARDAVRASRAAREARDARAENARRRNRR